jgi:uncharacterized protein
MPTQNISSLQTLFQSRLTIIEHLLQSAQTHFGDRDFLQKRIADDMFPLGTQIAFTCNQPRNFALWCDGKPANNLDLEVTSLTQASEQIANTKRMLLGINAEDAKLGEIARIDLGQNLYIETSGSIYINDFLMPNFYFHLVTAYNILRMAGVPIGKQDYIMHLMPFIKRNEA